MKTSRIVTPAFNREKAEIILKGYFSAAAYSDFGGFYQRGSLWGSLFALNPKNLLSKVIWKWTPEGKLEIFWEISDFFQVVTGEDYKFWAIEADGAVRRLEGYPPPLPDEKSGKKSVRYAVIVLSWGFFLAVFIGFFGTMLLIQKGAFGLKGLGELICSFVIISLLLALILKVSRKRS